MRMCGGIHQLFDLICGSEPSKWPLSPLIPVQRADWRQSCGYIHFYFYFHWISVRNMQPPDETGLGESHLRSHLGWTMTIGNYWQKKPFDLKLRGWGAFVGTCNRTVSGKLSLRRQTPAGFPPGPHQGEILWSTKQDNTKGFASKGVDSPEGKRDHAWSRSVIFLYINNRSSLWFLINSSNLLLTLSSIISKVAVEGEHWVQLHSVRLPN